MTSRARARLALFLPLLLLVAPGAGAATVSGRVLDSSGTPARGAKVVWEKFRSDEEVLVDETKGNAPAPLGETAADSEGRFQVKLDKPGVEVAIRILPGTLAGALLPGPYGLLRGRRSRRRRASGGREDLGPRDRRGGQAGRGRQGACRGRFPVRGGGYSAVRGDEHRP